MKKILGLALAVMFLASASTADAKTLTVGSTGSDVVALQTFLIGNGYPIPLIENGQVSKGYFGEQTKTAVMIYQEDMGMPLTGFIDSEEYGSVKLGAVVGTEVYNHTSFYKGITTGGYAATSSTATTYTLVAKDFINTPAYVAWTPNINTTISISSTSTQPYLKSSGDISTVYVKNASTTSGTITFAAKDANVDLLTATSTLVLNPGNWVKLTFVKTGVYSIAVMFDRLVAGD
jgi:peptidoglycan hydrolase-like protein with peptidoglycan-binding domain